MSQEIHLVVLRKGKDSTVEIVLARMAVFIW